MRTKHICVLIHNRINGEVGTVTHMFKPSNIFIDHSIAVPLLWILFFVISVSCLSCYAVLSGVVFECIFAFFFLVYANKSCSGQPVYSQVRTFSYLIVGTHNC